MEMVRSNEWAAIPCRSQAFLEFQPGETGIRGSPIPGVNQISRNIDSQNIRPQLSERNRRGAISAAKIQDRSGGAIPMELASDSPDCRMKEAISVKSPFSHNILFGFMVGNLYHAYTHDSCPGFAKKISTAR